MSDRYIEKSILLFAIVSLLLHLGIFAGFYYYPQPAPSPHKEPVFIDLQPTPEPMPPKKPQQNETMRRSEQQVRVPREMAPRGDASRDNQAVQRPRQPQQPQRQPAASEQQAEARKQSAPVVPGSSTAGLLKPKSQSSPQSAKPQLFPGASRMAQLEESYRRKFENDIAEGDTRFLNSDDIQFGSFLRRFEGAVYGVWRYPQEAAMRGIEGITPVRITFNRRGEITHIQQLESSGAKILDEEVLRTLRAIGPVGGFPKGYEKDEFHLIAFFQYGGAKRALR
ncbi:MAG TPA: TonB family protein [Desulfuromonadales bacterium]|nr:TonB family protein [Desulfuromonadales bacterium]